MAVRSCFVSAVLASIDAANATAEITALAPAYSPGAEGTIVEYSVGAPVGSTSALDMTSGNNSASFMLHFQQQLLASTDASATALATADWAVEQVLPSIVDSVSLTYTSSGSQIDLIQSVSGEPFVSSWYSYGPMYLSTTDESANIEVGFVKSYIPSTVSMSIGSSLGEASGSAAVYTEDGTNRTGSTSIALELNKQATILVSIINPLSGIENLNAPLA